MNTTINPPQTHAHPNAAPGPEPDFAAFVAIDWADQEHDLVFALMDTPTPSPHEQRQPCLDGQSFASLRKTQDEVPEESRFIEAVLKPIKFRGGL